MTTAHDHSRHAALAARRVDTVLITLDAELRTIAASLVDQLIDPTDARPLIRDALDRAAAALTAGEDTNA